MGGPLHVCSCVQTYLGGYSCETEAARAYDRAALVYWGNKGFTNVSAASISAHPSKTRPAAVL